VEKEHSRVMSLEKRDLEVRVSYGFIARGPLEDYAAVRDFIRSLPRSRLIYHTGSTRRLFMAKESTGIEKEEGETKIEQRRKEE
jgi:hypothetical protein